MTLQDSYDYIDLLLDKADQPYFLDDEKDMFLNLSITEFLNKKYQLHGINQAESESYGARRTLNQNSANFTQIGGSGVRVDDYHHLTSVMVNGSQARIISDDRALEIRFGDNPFTSNDEENPIAYVTGTTIYMQPLDLNGGGEFSLRYLRHLDTTDWDDIPEQYQHDILNIVVRKLTANIESGNYSVQDNESKQ